MKIQEIKSNQQSKYEEIIEYLKQDDGYWLENDKWDLTEEFENTEQFKWLNENAYKYGYILRYKKDKVYMTGYTYEPWHYRYVGVEAATIIKNENLTFEEYYVKYKGLY